MHGRRIVARSLVGLASLAAFLAIFALWANRQLLDTDNWTRTSSTLLERPVIREPLADFLVDRLYANVDVEGEISQALPPRLAPLAAPAAGQFRQLADRAALKALEAPRVQQLWADANRAAQRRVIQVLDGGGPGVSTDNGVVVLHLRPMLEAMAQRVGVGGRLASVIPAGADLTVLHSDQLHTAQKAIKLLRSLPAIAIGVSLLCFAVALAVAPDWRRKALRGYGIGLLAGGVGALLARNVTGPALADALSATAAVRPAIVTGWGIGTSLLAAAAAASVAYGVMMIAAAWLAGPTRPAVALRRLLAPYLRDPAIAYGGLVVVIGLLLWWAPTPATRDPWLALILVALLALGTEALRRVTAREHPDAVRGGHPMDRARDGVRRAAGWVKQGSAVVVQRGEPETAADQRIDQLERLARLRDAGVLGPDEFEAQKRDILAEEAPAPAPNGAASAAVEPS